MLNESSHLVSLFEYATEGFIVTGPKGNIILINPSACRMFGYTAEQLLGQTIEILVPEHYKKSHIALRHGFYQSPTDRVMGHGRDLRGQKQDGSQFPVEVSLSTYLRNNERYVTAFIVDISHRKEIEANMLQQQKQLEKVTGELRNLNAELEIKVEERTIILKEALQQLEQSQLELSEALDKEKQLNEIKSRFVSMASHEFRTPLSTVLSSAALLSRYSSGDEQPQRERHISKIKDAVKHLNDLLEDFLSLGKLDEGKVGTSLAEFDLKKVVEDTIDEMNGLLKEGQQIVYQHEGNEMIESDKKMLRNILINIISNAIKFSDPHKRIAINSAIKGEKAIISVKDQGIGISDEDTAHLFSSFFRGKNAQNIQGTGLGLHIVKRYLDLLGGTAKLESELNEGTTVTISIPAKQ
ncbi:MAG: PAS domain-containing sensor histidine kinase [Chitinophagaceae bacterium]|nr:PAS domain-containing sensor histidine kinase [Chitinophagaceae bacterium]